MRRELSDVARDEIEAWAIEHQSVSRRQAEMAWGGPDAADIVIGHLKSIGWDCGVKCRWRPPPDRVFEMSDRLETTAIVRRRAMLGLEGGRPC